MNKITLIGRISKDIEMRTTQNNVACATFSIAVERKYKVDGNKVADFFNCVAWRNTAEYLGKYFLKGQKIAISGELQTRNYEGKDGKKVYVVEVIVDEVEACEKREQNTTENNGGSVTRTEGGFLTMGDEDEDTKLPFDL